MQGSTDKHEKLANGVLLEVLVNYPRTVLWVIRILQSHRCEGRRSEGVRMDGHLLEQGCNLRPASDDNVTLWVNEIRIHVVVRSFRHMVSQRGAQLVAQTESNEGDQKGHRVQMSTF